MEIVGSLIKLNCKANGDPEPKIDWTLIALDGNELIIPRPIEEYPFITVIVTW
jgi:hypothetical protein